jgi:hypothetical protein
MRASARGGPADVKADGFQFLETAAFRADVRAVAVRAAPVPLLRDKSLLDAHLRARGLDGRRGRGWWRALGHAGL